MKTYKVVLTGDPTVGKTSIRSKFMGRELNKEYLKTIGANFCIKKVDDTELQIWDIAGDTEYSSVRKSYYQGSAGIIQVFDISNPSSYYNIPNWLNEINNALSSKVPFILVANKIDLRDKVDEYIKKSQVNKFAKELSAWYSRDVPFLETSALTGYNIDDLFKKLIEVIELSNETKLGN